MKKKQQEFDSRKWRFRAVLVMLMMVVMGSFGWWWKGQVQLNAIQVVGFQHAEEAELLEMANVDSSLAFFDIDSFAIADRVRRHPWVRDARVQRLPNATLHIEVVERDPAVLLIGADGRPDRYLDTDGFQMPFQRDVVYDVPLLMGLDEPIHPTEPLAHEGVKTLLQDLGEIPEEVDALLSAFELTASGEFNLQTAPKPGRGAINVRLGRDHFEYRLSKLHAFWHQAVLPKDETDFALIDLRFDSQIITQETRLSQ